jgi:TonB family protein
MLTQRVPRKNDQNLKVQQPFADIVSHALIEDPAARWTVGDIESRLAGKKVAAQKAIATHLAAPASVTSVPRGVPEARSTVEKSRLPLIAVAVVIIAVIAVAVFLMRGSSSQPAEQSTNTPVATSAPADSAQPTSNATSNSVASAAASGASGQVVNRVLPTPSHSALNTIHGTIKVRVKVQVDASGSVTHAGFVTSGPSQYFSRLAMQAAQQWKFAPGRSGEHTLLFAYNRSGVEASE